MEKKTGNKDKEEAFMRLHENNHTNLRCKIENNGIKFETLCVIILFYTY